MELNTAHMTSFSPWLWLLFLIFQLHIPRYCEFAFGCPCTVAWWHHWGKWRHLDMFGRIFIQFARWFAEVSRNQAKFNSLHVLWFVCLIYLLPLLVNHHLDMFLGLLLIFSLGFLIWIRLARYPLINLYGDLKHIHRMKRWLADWIDGNPLASSLKVLSTDIVLRTFPAGHLLVSWLDTSQNHFFVIGSPFQNRFGRWCS